LLRLENYSDAAQVELALLKNRLVGWLVGYVMKHLSVVFVRRLFYISLFSSINISLPPFLPLTKPTSIQSQMVKNQPSSGEDECEQGSIL